jgi:hypothetical protein
MSDIKEMTVEEMKQRIGRCYLASIELSGKAHNFRNVLVSSGSAQLLVQYDNLHQSLVGFKDAVRGELPLTASSTTGETLVGLVVLLAIVVAPWCFGVYKIFA